jgi:hypothetical protein
MISTKNRICELFKEEKNIKQEDRQNEYKGRQSSRWVGIRNHQNKHLHPKITLLIRERAMVPCVPNGTLSLKRRVKWKVKTGTKKANHHQVEENPQKNLGGIQIESN